MAKKKYIESPEKLWELFRDYVKEVKGKPILQHDFIGGKDLHEVRREKERPLTMEGFETYVMKLEGVKAKGIDQYFANQDGLYDNYMGICSRIRKEIKADQIEGGMAGIYNPSITQRLNNLTERQDITSKGKQVNLPEWMTTKK